MLTLLDREILGKLRKMGYLIDTWRLLNYGCRRIFSKFSLEFCFFRRKMYLASMLLYFSAHANAVSKEAHGSFFLLVLAWLFA